MEINFPYGRSTLPIKIEEKNIAGVVTPELPPAVDPVQEIHRALQNPIASPGLKEIVKDKQPRSIVILVTDISRPIPYQELLEGLLDELQAGGGAAQIKCIIATGAHRPNTEQETAEVFGELTQQQAFLNHNCDSNLVTMGTLNDGTELLINKDVAEADMIIATSCIMPHNLAGFSGGPKLILPGVAGRKTIEANHSMMTRQQVGPGNIKNNPISEQIVEAAGLVGVDFSLHVVLNHHNNIVKCLAGDLEASWREGCRYCQRIYGLKLPPPEEVVIAGAGGYPRDLNLYQAVKALVNGARLVRPGGTVVLVGECKEGMGEPLFKDWMFRSRTAEDLVKDFKQQVFILGGHKAYVLCQELKNKEVILISEIAKSRNPVPLLKNAIDWEDAQKMIVKKHGYLYRALLLPLAGLVFPLGNNEAPLPQ